MRITHTRHARGSVLGPCTAVADYYLDLLDPDLRKRQLDSPHTPSIVINDGFKAGPPREGLACEGVRSSLPPSPLGDPRSSSSPMGDLPYPNQIKEYAKKNHHAFFKEPVGERSMPNLRRVEDDRMAKLVKVHLSRLQAHLHKQQNNDYTIILKIQQGKPINFDEMARTPLPDAPSKLVAVFLRLDYRLRRLVEQQRVDSRSLLLLLLDMGVLHRSSIARARQDHGTFRRGDLTNPGSSGTVACLRLSRGPVQQERYQSSHLGGPPRTLWPRLQRRRPRPCHAAWGAGLLHS